MVSVAQVHLNGLPTVDADAINFQEFCAGGYGNLSREPYGVFLTTVYQLVGPSHLLGCELSQIAFSLALLALIELFYLFGLQKHAGKLILVFGLLPSVLLNTSVTLREPYQVMAFLFLALGMVKLMRDGIVPFPIVLVLVSMVLLALLHQGFALLIFVLAPFGLMVAGSRRPEILVLGFVCSSVLMLGLGGKLFAKLSQHSSVVSQLEKGKGLEYIDGYQESVQRGRSDFSTFLDLSSPGAVLKTGPIVMVNYMFSPLPWQVRSALDAYGFMETLVRATLFLGLLLGLRRIKSSHRGEYFLILGMYVLVEVMWASGTANWGTAFRHRVVGYGLLVILGGIGLLGQETDEESPGLRTLSPRARIREIRRRKRLEI